MNVIRVKELMLPLDDYATISENATLVDTQEKMAEASRISISSRGHQARAALVVDGENEIVGVLGHMDFLRALEPKYNLLGELDILSKARIDTEILDSMCELLGFWKKDLDYLCRQAAKIEVKYLMHPITESLDEDAPLTEAIHKMIIWQRMRVLVTRKGKVVGVLRLADLYSEVAGRMKTECRSGEQLEE